MTSTVVLAILASLIQIVAFGVYNKQILAGQNQPRIVSWGIWAFVTVLNFTSYRSMSGDWVKSILPTVSSIACILTFALAWFSGRAGKVYWFEKIALATGILSALVWWRFNSAMYANLVLQFSIAIGFLPTLESVIRKPQREKPLCWWMWTLGYVINTAVVVLRWRGQYQDLAYPVMCIFAHGLIALVAERKPHLVAEY